MPRVSQTPLAAFPSTRPLLHSKSLSSPLPSSSDPRRGKWTAANGQTEKHARSEKKPGESLRRRRRANHARTVNKLFQTLRGRDSCNPLTCRYTRDTQPIFHGPPLRCARSCPGENFDQAIDFARERSSSFFFFFEDRVNVRTKRLILSIGNNMGNISTHLGTKHSRDFLVRTVVALCNSTLTRVVGITIREKFTAFTRGRDKILRDPRV